MHKDDLAGILGATISTVLAAAGFVWNIGFFQLVFPYLAGALTTYVIQHRLQMESEKRENQRENYELMRDKIYGPIFQGTSVLLEKVLEFEITTYPIVEPLKGLMDDYLFFTVAQKHRDDLAAIVDRYEKYTMVKYAAEGVVGKIVRQVVKENCDADIGHDTNSLFIRLLRADQMFEAITLKDALFLGILPSNFFDDGKTKWGGDLAVEMLVGSKRVVDLSKLDSLYNTILELVKEEPLVDEEKYQRKALVEALQSFLEQIKPLVLLSPR